MKTHIQIVICSLAVFATSACAIESEPEYPAESDDTETDAETVATAESALNTPVMVSGTVPHYYEFDPVDNPDQLCENVNLL